MGTGILSFYQERIKKEWKTAFFSAFFLGLLVHLYKFTNLFPNADSLYNFYNSQDMTISGRWFLSIACCLGSYFDLPWVNGILSLFFMGLTAALVAEVFRMKNPVLIVLSSALQVSFPAIMATMAYEFTADGYMLAMALAALSVCLSRMEYIGKKHLPMLILSGLCICLSCGIYQAYVSFAFVLAVCYFLVELLENRWSDRQLWRWIGAQIIIYGCALAAYYLIWKLCLAIQGIGATTYQGIDRVGVMSAGGLIQGVKRIVKDFILFFVEWNFLVHGLTVYSLLNLLFLTFFAVVLLAAGIKSGILKRKVHLLLLLACLAALPVGCYLWYLTSPDVFYHTLMLQSICMIYVVTAVLFERWGGKWARELALLLLVAVAFNNSVTTNVYYNFMQQCYEKTYSLAVEVATRIHLLDDGNIKYIAFCGGLGDWEEEDYFDPGKLRSLGNWKNVKRQILSPMFLSLYTQMDLSYYRSNGLEYPVVKNDPDIPAPPNWEFRFPMADKESRNALFQTEAVQNMPVWPARDSVQVMGDTVVVKLSEIEES